MMNEPSEEMIIELVNSIEHRNILTELEVELSNEVIKDAKENKRLKSIINEIQELLNNVKANNESETTVDIDLIQEILDKGV